MTILNTLSIGTQSIKASILPQALSHISCSQTKSHPSNSPILQRGEQTQHGEGAAPM